MPIDLPEELRRVVGPLPELDYATYAKLSKPRRRVDSSVLAAVIVLIVTGAALWLGSKRPDSTVRFVSGGEATESSAGAEEITEAGSAARTEGVAGTESMTVVEPPASLDDSTWDVLAVGVTPNASLSGHVVTHQLEVDRLWQGFDMEEPAPILPTGWGALFVPVGGSCDSPTEVRSVDVISSADSGVVAAVHLDANCAEPTGDGMVHPGPRSLYVIGVPLEMAEHLGGAVAVQASLATFDWEVQTVGVTPDPSLDGHVVTDQLEADSVWRMFGMAEPSPMLPPGQGALIVAVSGTCDSAEQVRDVAAAPDDDAREMLAAVHFDASCAESPDDILLSPEPRTLYFITITVEAAESLSGVRAVAGT